MSETTLTQEEKIENDSPPDNDILGTDFGGESEVEETAGGVPASTPGSEAVGTAAAFDPDAFDWVNGDIAAVPGQYKHLQGVARKMQGNVTRKQQDLSDQLQQARNLQSQIAQRAQAPAPAPAASTQAQVDALASYKERYGVTPELAGDFDRAVELVRAVQKVDGASKPTYAKNEDIAKVVQAIRVLNNKITQTQAQPIIQEVSELNREYDNDPDNYGEQIASLLKVTNHATNRPYTLREAYLFASGKTEELAKSLRTTHDSVRATSQSQTRPEPATRSSIPEGGDMTPEAAQALLEKNFGMKAG